jgi:hypothetical protein
MGQSREETPSNNNFLAALHSGLEQAHEVRGGALDCVVGIVVLIFSSVQHRDHSANARA